MTTKDDQLEDGAVDSAPQAGELPAVDGLTLTELVLVDALPALPAEDDDGGQES